MAQVVNYYKKIGDLGKNEYFNPNKSAGALIHPFRCVCNSPSGFFKTNTVLNIINTCACFEKIILCAANGKSEPLYIFLKSKLGDKLVIIDDINDLPVLKSGVETKKKKKVQSKKRKSKKKESEDDEESTDSDEDKSSSDESESESEEESSDSEESSDEKPKKSNLKNAIGRSQKCVIFDDMIFEGKKVEKIINNWFARSRHANYSVILTSQSWFKIPRTVRLNTNYAIFLKMNSLREIKAVIGDFALEMKPDQLVQAYEYATKTPSHFLLIDLCDPDPTHKFRANFDQAIMVR